MASANPLGVRGVVKCPTGAKDVRHLVGLADHPGTEDRAADVEQPDAHRGQALAERAIRVHRVGEVLDRREHDHRPDRVLPHHACDDRGGVPGENHAIDDALCAITPGPAADRRPRRRPIRSLPGSR